MTAAARPSLHLIEDPLSGFDGELSRDNLAMLAARVTDLDATRRELEADLKITRIHERKLEADLKGKRLRIAQLEADREEKALASPERPQVEALHAVWKAGTGRATSLHFTDRERMGAAVKRLGFAACLTAIAGVAYDPRRSDPMRNGKRQTYDQLELVFRAYQKVIDFTERAPATFDPRSEAVVEKVAILAGVGTSHVEGWLGEAS